MKHLLQFFLVLAGTLLAFPPGVSAAGIDSYPYVANKYANEGWDKYLSNSNLGTITLDYSSSQPVKIELKSSTLALRSRLFSPALAVKPGYRYEVKFTASALNPNRAMAFTPYLTTEIVKSLLTADGVDEKILFTGDEVNTTSSANQDVTFTYDATEERDIYFMLDITTDRSKARTMIFSGFSVTETQLVKQPLPVEELVAECETGGSMEVTLKWKNPTQYLTGEDVEIAGIKVFRDDALLTTLTSPEYLVAGGENSWTDTPEVAGSYTYSLSVTGVSGYESEKLSVTTPFVGKLDAFTPPLISIFQMKS